MMVPPVVLGTANAALSGEQRRPLNFKHDAVNTEIKVNKKCQALGIRLKCFVMYLFSGTLL